ncbi:hypothetical protein AOL_s00007g45 [Orbilia oligospora ATCC 24927]|uniref:Uncharacterized protein n=1 Tax=Arthrobotrys oligospora (strain ATCC 24927 / CBS 115.81 / DSM 1491) TaxID=756982 RepID=G1X186_ARTOA|nr:hypothetical protein AOL_s00007g45 [Orbilia oligospora ATCC 24927]EGX53096.1 hypothetical protein AOL_s00007g45 [Orbilia oligospora ATCC 24927]
MNVEFQNPYYPYGEYHHDPCITGNCTSAVTVVVVHLTTLIEIRTLRPKITLDKYIVFLLYLTWHVFLLFYHFYYFVWAKPKRPWTVARISKGTAKISKKTYSKVKEWSKKKVQKDLYINPNQFERDESGPPQVKLKWREAVDINQMNRFRGLRRRKVVRQNKFDWFE